MSELQKKIKEQRLKCNYTLAEVAELIGVKEATVQRYESGEIKNIKHDTIVRLANIFKCTPAYLMGWMDEDNLYKNDDILTDIVFKFQADKEFREIVEDVYNASPELLNALKAFISAFKQ